MLRAVAVVHVPIDDRDALEAVVALRVQGGEGRVGKDAVAASLAVPDGAARIITGSAIGVVANALTVPLVALGSYRLYRALLAQASLRRAA
jgi:hypothetical protein